MGRMLKAISPFTSKKGAVLSLKRAPQKSITGDLGKKSSKGGGVREVTYPAWEKGLKVVGEPPSMVQE